MQLGTWSCACIQTVPAPACTLQRLDRFLENYTSDDSELREISWKIFGPFLNNHCNKGWAIVDFDSTVTGGDASQSSP